MAFRSTLNAAKKTDLVTIEIRSDGVEIPNHQVRLRYLTVSKEVNKIPFARITLSDGDVSKQDWDVSNTKYFEPGKSIEILAGFDGNNKICLLYTSPSPRDQRGSRMPSSA